MTVKVKICGLTTPEAVDAAVNAGADMVGFVFFEPSPRNIEISQSAKLMARVPDGITKVALTVNAKKTLLSDIVTKTTADLLQLHGDESPDHVDAIKERHDIAVMKMLPVSDYGDLDATAAYEGIADSLLFDAKPPKDATRPGGNAVTFDWTILQGFECSCPWVLAGGLTADNVAEAVRISGAEIVDVSSAVEDAPGVKNADKIGAFIRAAKSV
jgi:phosphoribosylanthranilate isomerase